MATEDPLPKGVGRVPQWWMDITPHNTLILEEEEAQRQQDYEEAMVLAQKATELDLQQKYGGEDYPDWNPAEHGPRTPQEEKEWTSTGYKRSEEGKWLNEKGEPLEGRQFKGKPLPGYVPGQQGRPGGGPGGKFGGSNLKSTAYAREDGQNWEKPSWTKVKLRSTGTGSAIRQGEYEKSPKKSPTKPAKTADASGAPPVPVLEEQPKQEAEAPKEEPKPEEPAAQVEEQPAAQEEEDEEKDGDMKLLKRVRRKRVSKPSTKRVSKMNDDGEEEFIEEIIDEDEYIEEEYDEEEYEEEIIEEILVEDEDGNEIFEDEVDTEELTELQKKFAKRATTGQ